MSYDELIKEAFLQLESFFYMIEVNKTHYKVMSKEKLISLVDDKEYLEFFQKTQKIKYVGPTEETIYFWNAVDYIVIKKVYDNNVKKNI